MYPWSRNVAACSQLSDVHSRLMFILHTLNNSTPLVTSITQDTQEYDKIKKGGSIHGTSTVI